MPIPPKSEVKSYARKGFTMIPVGMRMSSDVITPVLMMNRLRQLNKPCYLLESAEGGEQVGRYSFLGVDPVATVEMVDGKITHKTASGSEEIHSEDPLADIGRLLNQEKSPVYDGWPPFLGGAIGYLSYDAVRFIEKIPMPRRVLNQRELHLMFFRDTIIFDRLKHQIWFVTHYVPREVEIDQGYEKARDRLESLMTMVLSETKSGLLPITRMDGSKKSSKVKTKSNRTSEVHLESSASLGRSSYLEGVRKIKKHIKDGDIFQCVLADCFRMKLPCEPFLIYRTLRMINPSPYLFFLDFMDEILLGSSPEMLTRVVGGVVETCPIAGTRPRGADPSEDKRLEQQMLASVKERAEHLMLVDLGRNDIGRVARAGSVVVDRFMEVQRFSHVMHLVSLVKGKLRRPLTAWDALISCFPAGTLSGAPKIRAMEIISDIEQQRRGCYGGAVIAYDYCGNLNSCITIRSLWVRDGHGHIQAGAGVVADSRPDKEYEEVLNKARAMHAAINLCRS